MLDAVGHPVVRLARTAVGPLTDQKLRPGAWRPLPIQDEVLRAAEEQGLERWSLLERAATLPPGSVATKATWRPPCTGSTASRPTTGRVCPSQHCGKTEYRSDARFCSQCGTRLAVVAADAKR